MRIRVPLFCDWRVMIIGQQRPSSDIPSPHSLPLTFKSIRSNEFGRLLGRRESCRPPKSARSLDLLRNRSEKPGERHTVVAGTASCSAPGNFAGMYEHVLQSSYSPTSFLQLFLPENPGGPEQELEQAVTRNDQRRVSHLV